MIWRLINYNNLISIFNIEIRINKDKTNSNIMIIIVASVSPSRSFPFIRINLIINTDKPELEKDSEKKKEKKEDSWSLTNKRELLTIIIFLGDTIDKGGEKYERGEKRGGNVARYHGLFRFRWSFVGEQWKNVACLTIGPSLYVVRYDCIFLVVSLSFFVSPSTTLSHPPFRGSRIEHRATVYRYDCRGGNPMIMLVRSRAGPDVIFKVISSHLIRPATYVSRQLLGQGPKDRYASITSPWFCHSSRIHDPCYIFYCYIIYILLYCYIILLYYIYIVILYLLYIIYMLYIFKDEFLVDKWKYPFLYVYFANILLER